MKIQSRISVYIPSIEYTNCEENHPKLNLRKKRRNKIPVVNSTSGYCHEITLLHFRHLPRKIKKLNIGIKSRADIGSSQVLHFDRPFATERPS